ncbi:MAG: ABC transporter permease [Bdellovibrionales bacterium]|nr:ABC transporter permease [Bdellovibrionales bacterium]
MWQTALKKVFKKKMPLFCASIIIFFLAVAFACQFLGLASTWDAPIGAQYLPPAFTTFDMWLGTDILGRSVMYKVIQGTRIALSVGIITAILAAPIGIFFGMVSGYFGGFIDDVIVWFITTLSSIPSILLIIAISYSMGRGMTAVYIALTATSWIALARILRGEVLKHKQREYLIAAESIGVGHGQRIFKHLLPNVTHQIILSMTFMVEIAIRSEVLLSYLGLGVQNLPSWGKMIDDAKGELSTGVWWQLTGATVAMFFLMFAINVLGDYVRDALDPKAHS